MKHVKVILFAALAIIASACTDEVSDSMNAEISMDKSLVLKRNPNLPISHSKFYVPKNDVTRSSVINGNSEALLGCGYKLLGGTYVMGDFANFSAYPVVNLKALQDYDAAYVSATHLNTSDRKVVTFADFDRYQYNSTVTKKVSSGFSLNFKFFSLGHKKATTETFKTIIDNSNDATFGELSLYFISNQYSLQNSAAARSLYARKFIEKSFIKNLYNSTISSNLKNYGEFVVTGYLTGGKAYASYAGCNSTAKTTEGKEKGLEKSINASVTYKGATGSGELGFTSSNQSSSTTEFKSTDTFVQIKTFGGIQDGDAVVKTCALSDLNVDLSSWFNSLNDDKTHTIIDVTDNSLLPLSDFVLEKNFKQRFDDTTNGVLATYNEFVIPYMETARVMVRSTSAYEPLYDVCPVLVTRQGDRIIFKTSQVKTDDELRKNSNAEQFDQKHQAILEQTDKLFSVEIGLEPNKKARLNPMLRNPLCIEVVDFDKSEYYRYYNASNSVEYVYNPKKKVAFSYYVDEDEDEGDIAEVYGISSWVDSLPEKKIAIGTLANYYTIIGL